MRRAIEQLPEEDRTLVMLHHFEGKSHEEISAVMRLPVGTAKSRLNRARLRLRDILQRGE
jgi:RNA polymerase sigma-70 factor (ECF subfamily)